ncbi:antagonist of life heterochromatin protein 1-like 2 [Homarus americanus]|uniref:Antagonist of life heterochromatin protein 1-like 2 n=1 Tax=Homarus americanus TaxID=6706 RepID=A0A8J5JDP7_HOMAM|nr:antagonist of life heterochromatin protein 1-like 2 [Homarus americanus]
MKAFTEASSRSVSRIVRVQKDQFLQPMEKGAWAAIGETCLLNGWCKLLPDTAPDFLGFEQDHLTWVLNRARALPGEGFEDLQSADIINLVEAAEQELPDSDILQLIDESPNDPGLEEEDEEHVEPSPTLTMSNLARILSLHQQLIDLISEADPSFERRETLTLNLTRGIAPYKQIYQERQATAKKPMFTTFFRGFSASPTPVPVPATPQHEEQQEPTPSPLGVTHAHASTPTVSDSDSGPDNPPSPPSPTTSEADTHTYDDDNDASSMDVDARLKQPTSWSNHTAKRTANPVHNQNKPSAVMDEGLLRMTMSTVTLAICVQGYIHSQRMKKNRNRQWIKSWMVKKSKNVHHNLVKMHLDDAGGFFECHGMYKENFQELLRLVSPFIQKLDTKFGQAISPEQCLSVTLRYLATGESCQSLEFQYRINHNSISSIIPEVCRALYTALKGTYLKLPTTSDEWQDVASTFYTLWNFPMCIGALDRKRFLVTKQPNSGSEYCTYKSHHSIIMLALVDANYKFLSVDIGAQGLASDAGDWDKCTLRGYLEENKLQIPAPASLPFSTVQSPYVIVGDDTFPLKTYLMKPYQGKNMTADKIIFNCRLSRARSVSETAFVILSTKFRVFQQPISLRPDCIKQIIFASVALHNYLRVNCRTPLAPELLEKEDINRGMLVSRHWQEAHLTEFEKLQAIGRGHSNDAKTVRENFKDYFMNRGRVPWQDRLAQ